MARSWTAGIIATAFAYFVAPAHGSFWHEADIKLRPLFGRYKVESGHDWLVMSISAYDPRRTWPLVLKPFNTLRAFVAGVQIYRELKLRHFEDILLWLASPRNLIG
jgi:hypothetical protein